jgi:hypothetical protein
LTDIATSTVYGVTFRVFVTVVSTSFSVLLVVGIGDAFTAEFFENCDGQSPSRPLYFLRVPAHPEKKSN